MKQEISTPVAVILAVVAAVVLVVVGWQWINREPTATGVGANGAKITQEAAPADVPGQPNPASGATQDKPGAAGMIQATQ